MEASRFIGEDLVRKYSEAGVDIDAEGAAVRALVGKISQTLRMPTGEAGEVLRGIGHFCSLIRLDEDIALAIATDGVGSKINVAEALSKYDTIGIDLVAMNVNDIICSGAMPLSIVDYLAVERVDKGVAEEIGIGLSKGAELAGISISGGEIATLPEVIKGLDLAGTAVGIVKVDNIVSGDKISPGNVVIGLESSGIHSNGLTLARKVLLEHYQINDRIFGDRSVGEELLKPTKIYVREILEVLERIEVRGLANITGGGLGNLARITDYGFNLENLPEPQDVFRKIQELEDITDHEMYRTFNMGVGFCCVIKKGDEEAVVETCRKHGTKAWTIGRVVKEPGVHIKDFALSY